jgi:hypothetical protein
LPVTPNIRLATLYGHEPVPHGRVIGSVKCPQFNELKNVDFLIDSGSTFTTLLPYDVITLEIDWESLPLANFNCMCASGNYFRPRVLADVEIHLNNEDGVPTLEEVFKLPFINVMPPSEDQSHAEPYSLLGMDVLRNFSIWRWQFNSKLFLIR